MTAVDVDSIMPLTPPLARLAPGPLVEQVAAAPSRRAAVAAAPGTKPNRLVAEGGRYFLDGRPTLLRAADLQYFRVPAEQWAGSVEKLRAAGCNAIASYVPWSWHEPQEGALDFAGRTHPQRDLLGFLEIVRRAGLVFMARPGPFIYAEYRGFGYPEWLAAAIPEALCRRAGGRPAAGPHFQLYALLHPSYLAYAGRWYAAVAHALRPYLNDPVVSWQLDNETGMPFTIRIGELDFNPDTVERYRAYLREQYEDAGLLSRAWGRRVTRFEAVAPPLPPTCFRPARELADWQAFLETWIARYLQHLRRTIRALGVDLPLAANEPGEYLSPQNPRLKAPVAEMYGYDSYVKVTGSARTADFPWASSHHPLRFQQFAGGARPLTCWELGAGWWDWRAQVAPAATVQTLGAGLAHGLKGYNLYTAQDGHDPGGYTYRFGGLLDAQGRPTARLDAVARFHDFAAAHEAELTASIELQDPIVFLDYQPYTRLAPEDCLPLPISGLLEPMRYFAKWGFAGFHAVLQTAGYNVPFLDLESATDEALAGFAAAVFASRGYLDAESFLRLERFASGGGHLVTFPEPVSRHPDGSPLDGRALWPHAPVRASWCGRGRLIAHLIARWMLPYYLRTRWKTARLSPGALHLSDLIEPALVGQAAPLRCVPLLPTDDPTAAGVGEVGGDLRLVRFEEGGEVLLRARAGGASVAYRVPVGRGTSTVVGTIPGGAYTTSRYYRLAPPARRALRRFAVRLIERAAPRRLVPDDTLEVEAVARLCPDAARGSGSGCLLFVVNRLGAQRGTIHFPSPAALNLRGPSEAEVLFSAFGSRAAATAGGLALDLAPDDVLIVRLR